MTWPAMLSKKTALAYLELSEAAFAREIAAGRIPDGVMFGGKLHWYKAALDSALAAIAGGTPAETWEAKFYDQLNGKAA